MTPGVAELVGPSSDEEALETMHWLWVTAEAEELPGDEPKPLAQRLADWRHPHEHDEIYRWLLRDGPTGIGFAGAWMNREQNLRNALGWVFIHPEWRGMGLARVLAKPMLAKMEETGRDRISTEIKSGDPGEAIAKKAGLKSAYTEKMNRLEFADIDWDLMARWVERAKERASHYRLVEIEPPVPNELLEKFAELSDIMNTAPREEFEEDDEEVTPEMFRDMEAKQAVRGRTLPTVVAEHIPSGDWVGYTMVAIQSLHPHVAEQWDTAVHPDHRTNGLGRWLKAQMILNLRDRHPDIRRMDTWNAGSNEPMLNINIAMGFRPILVRTAWQGDLATLRERLNT